MVFCDSTVLKVQYTYTVIQLYNTVMHLIQADSLELRGHLIMFQSGFT